MLIYRLLETLCVPIKHHDLTINKISQIKGTDYILKNLARILLEMLQIQQFFQQVSTIFYTFLLFYLTFFLLHVLFFLGSFVICKFIYFETRK